MPRYRITTLIDITRTQAKKNEDTKKYLQQCNFNTLIQAIGLRANPDWEKDPISDIGTLPPPFQGKARYWIWDFDVERDDVFAENANPVSLLEKDMNGVPIITGLDETVDANPSAFVLLGNNINTHIKII